MKTVIFLVTLIISCVSMAQTNITDLDRVNGTWVKRGTKTPYTGKFVEYFDNGKLKGTGNFKNGVPDGERVQYHENGNKKTERVLKAGVYTGPAADYYENGVKSQEGQFNNGKEDGTWKLYYETGKLKAVITFKDGVQHGDFMEYATDGKLMAQFFYKNGEINYSDEFLELTKKAMDISRKGKYEEAIKLYDKAIALNPTVAQAYFNRATSKEHLFDFAGAIADYDKAIELDPEYKEAYTNRGTMKINVLNTDLKRKPTPEEAKSACEDFHKGRALGDKSVGNEDMIFLYCEGKKK